jgi:hypothetical protein
MSRVKLAVGDAILWDGEDAAELATAIGDPDGPTVNADGTLTLDAPLPIGGFEQVVLAPGDGLVLREAMGGFLVIRADQVATFRDPENVPREVPFSEVVVGEPPAR